MWVPHTSQNIQPTCAYGGVCVRACVRVYVCVCVCGLCACACLNARQGAKPERWIQSWAQDFCRCPAAAAAAAVAAERLDSLGRLGLTQRLRDLGRIDPSL